MSSRLTPAAGRMIRMATWAPGPCRPTYTAPSGPWPSSFVKSNPGITGGPEGRAVASAVAAAGAGRATGFGPARLNRKTVCPARTSSPSANSAASTLLPFTLIPVRLCRSITRHRGGWASTRKWRGQMYGSSYPGR
jgi:hypothetical protein